MNKRLALASCVLLVLAACAAPVTVQLTAPPAATLPSLPTYTPYPTYTAPAPIPVTVQVPVTVIVTVERSVYYAVTATPLPATATPAETDTPVPTDSPKTQTAVALGPLTMSRPDGNYLVNVDVAPGEWRNDGSASDGTNCYWERLGKTGNIIANYIGAGNGAMYVAASDYQIHMENCGNWTYLSGP